MINYKGFIGQMEIDEDEEIIYGRVVNLAKDGITFEGKTIEEAKEDFKHAVDDYLEWAEEEGFEPEKPFQGNILVRATPELHREATIASSHMGISLNALAVEAIQEKLQRLVREEHIPSELLPLTIEVSSQLYSSAGTLGFLPSGDMMMGAWTDLPAKVYVFSPELPRLLGESAIGTYGASEESSGSATVIPLETTIKKEVV